MTQEKTRDSPEYFHIAMAYSELLGGWQSPFHFKWFFEKTSCTTSSRKILSAKHVSQVCCGVALWTWSTNSQSKTYKVTLVNKWQGCHKRIKISPLPGFIKENLGKVPLTSMHQDINASNNQWEHEPALGAALISFCLRTSWHSTQQISSSTWAGQLSSCDVSDPGPFLPLALPL